MPQFSISEMDQVQIRYIVIFVRIQEASPQLVDRDSCQMQTRFFFYPKLAYESEIA